MAPTVDHSKPPPSCGNVVDPRVRGLRIGTLAMFAIGVPTVVRYWLLGLPAISTAVVVTMVVCTASLAGALGYALTQGQWAPQRVLGDADEALDEGEREGEPPRSLKGEVVDEILVDAPDLTAGVGVTR